MSPEVYTFSKNNTGKYEKYIFQLAKDRPLSAVYHAHDFYEVVVVLCGTCVQNLNGVEKPFQKNEIVILRPGDCHAFVSQSNDVQVAALSVETEEFERFCYAFDPLLTAALRGAAAPICFACSEEAMLGALWEKGVREGASEYACKWHLSHILTLYLDDCAERDTAVPPCLKQALEKMVRPEYLNGGIAALVALSGYSRSHLSRLMKEHLGVTLHEYVLEKRLVAAYDLLVISGEGIEEISERLGYASLSHFNKIFKRKFGVSPAAFRRQNGWRTV